MKNRIQIIAIIILFTVGNSWLMAQTYNDGPTQLRVKVREIFVSLNPGADANLNLGSGGIGFAPDEYVFRLGVRDNPNTSVLPWQFPTPNPLEDAFDPPLLSRDFDAEIFNHTYGSAVSPKYFSLQLDAFQDNCGSDGAIGVNCGGSPTNFEGTCTDFLCGSLLGVGDNERCNASLFKDTLNYRAAGPPCQWNSHGQVPGNCPSNNNYEPVMESFWRYTLGTNCTPTEAIDLGTLSIGSRLSHYNSTECYTNNFASSPGNDVFYKFTISTAIGVTVELCSPRTLSTFDTQVYLLDASCAIDSSNDDNCGILSKLSKTICNVGVYYIVVDGKTAGDFGPFELVVYEDSNFTFSADPIIENPRCTGQANGTIKLNVKGGTGPYLFDWPSPLPDGLGLDSAGGLTGTAAPGLDYAINIIDNDGCQTTTIATLIDPPPMTVAVDSTNVTCGGTNDGTATATPMGGTPPYIEYRWSNNPGLVAGPQIIGLGAGAYSVTVTDLNLCTAIGATTVVPPPTALSIINPSRTNITCFGANDGTASITVVNGAPPYTITWSSGDTTLTASGLQPGQVDVLVSDTAGCFASMSFDIEEPQLLTASIDPANVSNITCNEGDDGTVVVTVLGGTQPYVYQWTLDSTTSVSTNLSVINAVAGSYDVVVTDLNGCTSTASQVLTEPAAITSSITPTTAGCVSGTGAADLTASGGTGSISYLWSTQETSEDISNLAEGSYSVVITDANGCNIVDTTTITGSTPPTVEGPSNNPTCFGFSDGSISLNVLGDGPFTYLWDDGSATDSLTQQPAGEYSVTVTDANGCSVERTYQLEERAEGECFSTVTDYVAIPNAFSPNNDGQNDCFDLYAKGTDKIEVQVFDRWGARVYSNQNQEPNTLNQGWDGKINGDDAPTGSYVYLINIVFTDPLADRERQRTGTITLLR